MAFRDFTSERRLNRWTHRVQLTNPCSRWLTVTADFSLLAEELYEYSRNLLPKCTQCVSIQIDETYKLEYPKEPETERTEGDLF